MELGCSLAAPQPTIQKRPALCPYTLSSRLEGRLWKGPPDPKRLSAFLIFLKRTQVFHPEGSWSEDSPHPPRDRSQAFTVCILHLYSPEPKRGDEAAATRPQYCLPLAPLQPGQLKLPPENQLQEEPRPSRWERNPGAWVPTDAQKHC